MFFIENFINQTQGCRWINVFDIIQQAFELGGAPSSMEAHE